MESLEAQEKVINLGKLFVKELKLEPGVDTFSRWMAHYLAEKITVAEQSEGKGKEVAEKECFDVILKLWEHRHSLPSGKRPLESFEPIVELLRELSEEQEDGFFIRHVLNKESPIKITEDLKENSIDDWISIAKEIDKVARVWINFCIRNAVSCAKDEKTDDWLKNSSPAHDNPEVQIIKVLLDDKEVLPRDGKEDHFENRYEIMEIQKRIEQLESFKGFNQVLLDEYKKKLENYI